MPRVLIPNPKSSPTSKTRLEAGRDRVKRIYEQLVSRFPPELRGGAPVLEISKRRYTRSIAHYYKYRKGPVIVEKIRVDPRAVEFLSDSELKHILVHELAHFVLDKRGVDYIINSLHLDGFYQVLAEIAGYSSPGEAERIDYTIRLKYEEKINNSGKI